MAHPDDECFLSGGTIRLEADRGAWVGLAIATAGEEGEIVNPDLRGTIDLSRLPAIRQDELDCSVRTLGIARTWHLGYRDSGMEGDSGPDAFVNADLNEAAGKVVALMRQMRPQVVATFDERGGYGHRDHITINRITRLAFERSGDSAWYPEAGAPWQPLKLYYAVAPRMLFDRLRAAFEARGEEFSMGSGLPNEEEIPFYPDEYVTTVIDITDTVLPKREALRCYATQVRPDFAPLAAPDAVALEGMNREYFTLVRSQVKTEIPEHDLFAGVDGTT